MDVSPHDVRRALAELGKLRFGEMSSTAIWLDCGPSSGWPTPAAAATADGSCCTKSRSTCGPYWPSSAGTQRPVW
jgi:hypothetical protein